MGAEENRLFESLYEKWFSSVYSYFAVCFGDEYAEELSQETFVRVWKKCTQSPPDNWQAWIFRIAVNIKNDFLREKYRSNDLQNRMESCIMLNGQKELDCDLEVREAFDALTDDEREILALKAAGFSGDEIGDLIGITASGARSRLQRAKRSFLNNLSAEA